MQKKYSWTVFCLFVLLSMSACRTASNLKSTENNETTPQETDEFVIAFGSCNRVDRNNPFWDDILDLSPDLWIWGGDNIYADTKDMKKMEAMYNDQLATPGYGKLVESVPVIGTWDDHDYGLNDGGIEFESKVESQQLLLDFLGVPKNSPRRVQEGIYSLHRFERAGKRIHIYVLDTRYFRTSLSKGKGNRRYSPSEDASQSMLGEEQWAWLSRELSASQADFNLIVSSIQFISSEHGFEKWANMPNELLKMESLIQSSGARGVIFLSGDRHISEFSRKQLDDMKYPIWDFTSSGLTHSYSGFKGEPNQYRVGNVHFKKSFGVLRFDSAKKEVRFEIRGEGGKIFQQEKQSY